jgi:hypothetical protein
MNILKKREIVSAQDIMLYTLKIITNDIEKNESQRIIAVDLKMFTSLY